MKQKIKGVVMEVQEYQIVLMCDDGTFRNVPRDKHDIPVIGEYVTYRVKKSPLLQWNRKQVLPLVALAAILLVAIMNSSFYQPQQQAYLLAVDINPSMEISLDEDLNVIDITGLNDDAKRVIKDLDVKGKPIDKVINDMVVRLKDEQYLSADTPAIITATWIGLQDHSISNDLRSVEKIFSHSLGENHVEAEMEVYVENEQYYKEAKEVNLSVNSYRLYQKMINDEVVVDINEVQNKSIKEIRQMAEKANKIRNDDHDNPSSSQDKEEVPYKEKEEKINSSSKSNSGESSSNRVPKTEHAKQPEKDKNGKENKQNAEQALSKKEKHNSDKERDNEKSAPEKSNPPSNDKNEEKKMEKPPSNEKTKKVQQKQQPNNQKPNDPETPKKAEEKAGDKGKPEEKSTEKVPEDHRQDKGNDSNRK
ncbi:hypothetical protein GI584_08560 [Gracilibacillus salitolerans]|uniref:RsgI N-terminal anti-sigma domain-containing protein n=1 Tax=Gracilibacillus salitolerans TaxID=2663022 RepID=A0A5Q2TIU1_9BACI|nr:hypothetical protein [Gracilibacillus salitolerans]QGH34067.1 hypothetical protein GI584_08560 [Gracilibacillus salitolerans]